MFLKSTLSQFFFIITDCYAIVAERYARCSECQKRGVPANFNIESNFYHM